MGRRIICIVVSLLFLLTTAAAGGQRTLAAGVLAELNLTRTAPESYAESLRELRRRYQGKVVIPPGTSMRIVTEEGVAAVDEAIRFLSRQKPLRPLTSSAGLKKAAEALVKDQGRSGAIGHEGAGSGDMRQRIERHGTWRGRIGENISYGPAQSRWVVMSLIIDDGVPGRGHRKNIFDRSFGTAGIACGPHTRFGTMCVMDFATAFSNGKK